MRTSYSSFAYCCCKGLPTWNALLQELAQKVGVQSEEQMAYFNALDFLSKAQVVQQRMPAGRQVLS